MPQKAGRPRKATQELLQEAAFELFQLRGYRGTTAEQIARTAGFSRATFFHVFASKAELFWVESDALLAKLEQRLAATLQRAAAPPPSAWEALLSFAEQLNRAMIPWALKNYRLIEAEADLVASGAARVLRLQGMLLGYERRRSELVALPRRHMEGAGTAEAAAVAERSGTAHNSQATSLTETAEVAALTARFLTGLLSWIDGEANREFREVLLAAAP